MHINVSTRLRSHCIRALTESMEPRVMTHMIREIFPGYDIHARTGFPESLSIPNKEVAGQIVVDVIDAERFPTFVALLIRAHEEGFMGRKYPISYLREIIKGTFELGFIYDSVNRFFVEDPKVRHTRNWGVLQEGMEYTLAFIAVDIVGNTKLVRKYSDKDIQKTYQDIREIVQDSVIRRNGRIWNWEGDGGLAAFFFGNKHMSAAVSAIEIIHELFIYNRTRCILSEPVFLRIGVHAGSCEYTDNLEDLKKIQTVKETADLEQRSAANAITISIVIKVMLEDIIAREFNVTGKGKNGPFSYKLEFQRL